MGLGKGPLN